MVSFELLGKVTSQVLLLLHPEQKHLIVDQAEVKKRSARREHTMRSRSSSSLTERSLTNKTTGLVWQPRPLLLCVRARWCRAGMTERVASGSIPSISLRTLARSYLTGYRLAHEPHTDTGSSFSKAGLHHFRRSCCLNSVFTISGLRAVRDQGSTKTRNPKTLNPKTLQKAEIRRDAWKTLKERGNPKKNSETLWDKRTLENLSKDNRSLERFLYIFRPFAFLTRALSHAHY